MKKLIALLILTLTVFAISAQDDVTRVELEAEDGLVLVGDFIPLPETPDDDAPAVLLLHMLGSDRGAWDSLLMPLQDAGYHILNVDMRGHGETGGSRDWELAETDHQLWLDWLKGQEGVRTDAIAVVGGSIGSNMALIACANDMDCVTAIALSPGLDYSGVMPETAVTEGLAERSALLVGARNDGAVADSVLQMAANAPGEVGLRLYPGRAHGTRLLEDESVITMIIHWLDAHTAA